LSGSSSLPGGEEFRSAPRGGDDMSSSVRAVVIRSDVNARRGWNPRKGVIRLVGDATLWLRPIIPVHGASLGPHPHEDDLS